MNEASPVSMAGPALAEPAFIPVCRTDVIDALLSQDLWPSGAQRSDVADVLNKIGLLRQHKSGEMLNQLSDIYDPFNPDDETINLTEPSEIERLEKRRMFNAKLKELVTSANYQELQADELAEILTRASPDGVQVDIDFQEYDVKLMFYRGETQHQEVKTRRQTAFPETSRLCSADLRAPVSCRQVQAGRAAHRGDHARGAGR